MLLHTSAGELARQVNFLLPHPGQISPGAFVDTACLMVLKGVKGGRCPNDTSKSASAYYTIVGSVCPPQVLVLKWFWALQSLPPLTIPLYREYVPTASFSSEMAPFSCQYREYLSFANMRIPPLFPIMRIPHVLPIMRIPHVLAACGGFE